MGKILGSFSGMRKYLEKEMLAPALLDRVRYGCTHFVGMDNCRVFEVAVDGQTVKRFSWETVNSSRSCSSCGLRFLMPLASPGRRPAAACPPRQSASR